VTASELRQFVVKRAKERCEYCLLPQSVSLTPYQLDHVISKQHGGSDDENNLALCCPQCNRYKGPNVATLEPTTGNFVGFFNPRRSLWRDHFRLEAGMIIGSTPQGQATVMIFRLNEPVRVTERLELIELGLICYRLTLESGIPKHSAKPCFC
jgi:HNH endonuclease